jgi:hypothetical protein
VDLEYRIQLDSVRVGQQGRVLVRQQFGGHDRFLGVEQDLLAFGDRYDDL